MKDVIEQSIEALEEKVLRLEQGKVAPGLISEVMASLGLSHLKLNSAQLTAMFDMLADGIQPVTPQVVDALLSICDGHRRLIYAMAGDVDDRADKIRQKREEAEAAGIILEDEEDSAQEEPMAAEPADAEEESTEAGEEPSEPERKAAGRPQKGQESISSIRVNTVKLDKLIDHVGKLMVIYAVVAQSSNLDSATISGLKEMDDVIEKIKNEVERIRLVPLKQIFVPIHRLVKSLITKMNKKVRFEVLGDDLELDKQIVEHINEPLVHLLRNAVDHGLETPEERAEAGKDETGLLTLKAWRKGEFAYLEVSDDGRGLNAEKIRAKALEKGLIGEDDELSEEQVFQLIMKSGFSTADRITDVSGRGVGMDAVLNTIKDQLGGEVRVSSKLGEGSSFTISIPLSRSVNEGIVDALVTMQGGELFILPSKNVVEVYSITEREVADLHDGREIIDVRGEMHKLVRLDRFFGLEGCSEGVNGYKQAVVVQIGDKKAALLVDEVIRKQQVVITSFTVPITEIYHIPILGFGLMGENNALVLDVEDLLERVDAAEHILP